MGVKPYTFICVIIRLSTEGILNPLPLPHLPFHSLSLSLGRVQYEVVPMVIVIMTAMVIVMLTVMMMERPGK